jgi:hypothetical protein
MNHKINLKRYLIYKLDMSNTNEKHLTSLENRINEYRNKQLLLADAIAMCERKKLQCEYQADMTVNAQSQIKFEQYHRDYLDAQEIVSHLMERVNVEFDVVKCAAAQLARARSNSPRRASP